MKIAVIGATGAVGREMLRELEAPEWSSCEVLAFASPSSDGKVLPFRNGQITVKGFSLAALEGVNAVLMSAGGDFSRKHARSIAEVVPFVIDNSSAWRTDPETPLIVPEVNGDCLKDYDRGIIANPNCSTIQLVVALKPLSEAFGLEQVQVTTLQSVSGSGQKGIETLLAQTQAHLQEAEIPAGYYQRPISFNVLSYIGDVDVAGHCEEERKIIFETRKILGQPKLEVMATTSRVPVLNCHSESVTVRLQQKATLSAVMEAFRAGEGLTMRADCGVSGLPDPREYTGLPDVAVSRVRLPQGATESQWVQFWNVADNLKKGAATNAVQILKLLK